MRKRSFISLFALAALLSGYSEPAGEAKRAAAPPASPENASNPQVLIQTTEGDIVAELFADKAPLSAENFLKYVEKKHYDKTIFHRVMKKFMIQGGGFEDQNGRFVEKETLPPIKNESSNGVKNRRGTLAMARTNDLNSATSQFYINTVDNASLDSGQYAVFGKVLSGMEVVDAIEAAKTSNQKMESKTPDGKEAEGPHDDVPNKKIVIHSIAKK